MQFLHKIGNVICFYINKQLMCFQNFFGFARERAKRRFLLSFLSAHNIMLCRGQCVARELRVEQACSNICEFYAKKLEKNNYTQTCFLIFLLDLRIRFLLCRQIKNSTASSVRSIILKSAVTHLKICGVKL